MSTASVLQSRYSKRSRLRRLRGETAYVDATSMRLHIATLTGHGWSLRAIAGTSGVPASTVSKISSGAQANARPETIAAVLAVRPGALPAITSTTTGGEFVSRVGTVRRIQALLVMGWPHEHMRAVSGVTTENVICQQGRWVTRSTHDAIAALYRDLSHRRGPSELTASRALSRGYRGPAAWDDIDRDEAPEKDEYYCAAEGCVSHSQRSLGHRVARAHLCDRHAREAVA